MEKKPLKNRHWLWITGALMTLTAISLLGAKYINPVIGKIVSRFGNRVSPLTGKSEFHNGVDIVAVPGTPVKSPASGTVLETYYNSAGGNQLIIQHGELITGYAHLNSIAVIKGSVVQKGQVIAYTGNTGQTTGPHLHFTCKINGTLADPEKIFTFKS